jgi:hypothetical protein
MARRAWERLQSEFPIWTSHLDVRDGELEFAIPAPVGSQAGYLIAFSHENQLWIRFAPPYLSYAVGDEDEMVVLIRKLTSDEIVFKLTMKGDEWVETTLSERSEESEFRPWADGPFCLLVGKVRQIIFAATPQTSGPATDPLVAGAGGGFHR